MFAKVHHSWSGITAVAVQMLFGNSAASSDGGPELTETEKRLSALVIKQIRSMTPEGRRLRIRKYERPEFAIYTRKKNDVAAVKCESAISIGEPLSGRTHERLLAGICETNAAQLSEAAQNGAEHSEEVLKELPMLRRGNPDYLKIMGIYNKKSELEDGSMAYYFPLILVGHGLALIPTYIVPGKNKTFILQSGLPMLCSGQPRMVPGKIETPENCVNTMGQLEQIGKKVFESLGGL